MTNVWLPEIFSHLQSYLSTQDLAICQCVCVDWYRSFAPAFWSSVVVRSKRQVLLFSDVLALKAPWIRTLIFEGIYDNSQFLIGPNCDRLCSLTLTGHRPAEPHHADHGHWKNCKVLVRQNRATLESLTLSNMVLPSTKSSRRNYPHWSPLVALSACPWSRLKSLKIEKCQLDGIHLKAFWNLGDRLESLELGMDAVLVLPPSGVWPSTAPLPQSNSRKRDGVELNHWEKRFPRLQNLKLYKDGNDSSQLLECLIKECPELRSLSWTVHSQDWIPVHRFVEALESSSAQSQDEPHPKQLWPKLESLTITGLVNGVFDDTYRHILEKAPGTLRKIQIDDLFGVPSVRTLEAFERHLATLCEFDLYTLRGPAASDLLRALLEKCPALEKVRARMIHGQYLMERSIGCGAGDDQGMDPSEEAAGVRGLGQRWACMRLKEFRMVINMDPRGFVPPRQFSIEEEQAQTAAVFSQLGRLERLEQLDVGRPVELDGSEESAYWRFRNRGIEPGVTIKGLPFTLNMGLGKLHGLKRLERVRFHGHQSMQAEDVEWVMDQWRSLKCLEGGTMTMGSIGGPNSTPLTKKLRRRYGKQGVMSDLELLLARRLNTRGIETPGSCGGDQFHLE